MYLINYKKSFLDDYERILENKKFNKSSLEKIIDFLVQGYFLELRKMPYRAHKLKGNYIGCWDVHVRNDIVLIYTIDESKQSVDLIRIGTHSQIF